MKFLVLISALFVIALAEETDPHGRAAVHEKCQSNPETHIEEGGKGRPENLTKHIICMVKGLKMMNEDGTVNVEGIKTHVHHVITEEAKVDEIVKRCGTQEDTPEKQAWHIWKCLHKAHVLTGGHGFHNHESDESGESDENHGHKHEHGHHH